VALRSAAGSFLPQLAQGVAFAAKARERAGNLTPHTERACHTIWGAPASLAAQATDSALENLPTGAPEPAYEVWRLRVQAEFVRQRPESARLT
jgi:hypothetical protein